MSIPAFNIDGVLPPYTSARGPGAEPELMTPYRATALEVVSTFGTSSHRRKLLGAWLSHRAAVRAHGFSHGFQWIDGSFVEDKVPDDLDVVTFTRRPSSARLPDALGRLMRAHPKDFVRAQIKAHYRLDAFFVDLDGSKEGLVNLTRYYTGLFSHRRDDALWKGMVEVSLNDATDDDAATLKLAELEKAESAMVGST